MEVALAAVLTTLVIGVATPLLAYLTRRGDRDVEAEVRAAEQSERRRDERAVIYVRTLKVAEAMAQSLRAGTIPSPALDDDWLLLQAELGAYGSVEVFDAFDAVYQRTITHRRLLQHGETAERMLEGAKKELRRPIVTPDERARQVNALGMMLRSIGKPLDSATQEALRALPPSKEALGLVAAERSDLQAKVDEYRQQAESTAEEARRLLPCIDSDVASLRTLVRRELDIPGRGKDSHRES
jgi:hypothetical protein